MVGTVELSLITLASLALTGLAYIVVFNQTSRSDWASWFLRLCPSRTTNRLGSRRRSAQRQVDDGDQYHFVLSTQQEEEIRESFLVDCLCRYTMELEACDIKFNGFRNDLTEDEDNGIADKLSMKPLTLPRTLTMTDLSTITDAHDMPITPENGTSKCSTLMEWQERDVENGDRSGPDDYNDGMDQDILVIQKHLDTADSTCTHMKGKNSDSLSETSTESNDACSNPTAVECDIELGTVLPVHVPGIDKKDDDSSQGEDSILPSLTEYELGDEAGVVLVPPPGSSGRSGDSSKLQKDEVISRREAPNMCAICICPFEAEDRVTWSSNESCQHIFHYDCILDWLKSSGRRHCRKRRRQEQQDGILNYANDPLLKITRFPMHCPSCRQDFIKVSFDDCGGKHDETLMAGGTEESGLSMRTEATSTVSASERSIEQGHSVNE